jgi:tetratricopeptide (TPR) repeat protein
VATASGKTKKKSAETWWMGIPLQRMGPYIAILGALIYFQTITFDYTQDDAIVINQNMFTTKGIDGIPGLFGHDTFYGYFKDEGKTRLVSGGRYRPLTPVMFAIEYALVGEKPWLSHLVNALCYGALCWILFLFVRDFCGARMTTVRAHQVAAIAALIFAVHPIHTEAVANIKGRDEIMAALGAITGLWLLIRSLKSERPGLLLAGAFLAFFLGLLAKENVITMLAVVPITIWWHGKAPAIQWVRHLLPIVAASVLFLLIRGSVTGWSPGKPPLELMNNPFLKVENNSYVPFTVAEKSATIVYIMGKYVQLLIFPYPLTHDYYPRQIEIQDWSKPLVLISMLFWLGMLYIVIKGWKTRGWWVYGILFYVCTMSITSNIVFPVGTNMSERFAFLPSVGFAFIVGLAFAKGMESFGKKQMTALLLVMLMVLAGWTLWRSRVWKDNNALFSTDIKTSTRSAKLLNAAGGNLVTQSEKEENPAEKQKMLLEAQGYLKQALEIHPNYKLSYLLMGNSYFYLGNYEEAIRFFRHVLSLDPDYGEGRRNLGVALRDWGKVQGEQNNNLAGAISLLEEAVQYLPNDFETYHLLGVAYGQKGDTPKAIAYFQKEIELAPKNASAYFNLGVAYRQLGDTANAAKAFEQAKTLDPNLPQFKNQQ